MGDRPVAAGTADRRVMPRQPIVPGEARRARQRRGAAAIVAAAAVAGCGVTVERPGGEAEHLSVDEFRAYAESVFRRQNAAQDRLIFLLYDLKEADPQAHARLSRAETRMLEACSGLVEVAAERRRGREPGFWKRVALRNDVVACDRAVTRVEELLSRFGDSGL